MNVTILYYDESSCISKEQIHQLLRDMKDRFSDTDTQFIALPKNYDIMLNCSIDQLETVRDIIDSAIRKKKETSNN